MSTKTRNSNVAQVGPEYLYREYLFHYFSGITKSTIMVANGNRLYNPTSVMLSRQSALTPENKINFCWQHELKIIHCIHTALGQIIQRQKYAQYNS